MVIWLKALIHSQSIYLTPMQHQTLQGTGDKMKKQSHKSPVPWSLWSSSEHEDVDDNKAKGNDNGDLLRVILVTNICKNTYKVPHTVLRP